MTIIQFPGGKGPDRRADALATAVRLKQRLISFVVTGLLRDAFVESVHDNEVDFSDENERIEFTDWFIFEWEDEDGSTAIDQFVEAGDDLSTDERSMLRAWNDGSMEDVFRIAEVRDGGLDLADAFGNRYLALPTSAIPGESGVQVGSVISTRIVPVSDFYVLSGIQKHYGSGGATLLGPEGLPLAPGQEDEESLAALMAEDGRLEDDDVDDLLEYEVESYEPGSVARVAREFLRDCSRSGDEKTFGGDVKAMNALVRFTDEVGPDGASEMSGEHLLEFLALWYPRQWFDRTPRSAESVVNAVGRFAAWMDAQHGTRLARAYERDVAPNVRDELPRCMQVAHLLELAIPPKDPDADARSLIDGTSTDIRDIVEGIFDVILVESGSIRLSSPEIDILDMDGTGTADLLTVTLPVSPIVTEMIRCNDCIECIAVLKDDTWSLADLRGYYPAAARPFLSPPDVA